MSVKEANEITIKITCSNNELIKLLTSNGFTEGRKFTLDDYYLIPKDLDIEHLTTREILSKAIIVRYIVNNNKITQKLTFKKKNINENGEIISQKAINFDTVDKLKKLVMKLEIPIEKDNYFVKKAEDALNKILNR